MSRHELTVAESVVAEVAAWTDDTAARRVVKATAEGKESMSAVEREGGERRCW
jgi:hypothetical protein